MLGWSGVRRRVQAWASSSKDKAGGFDLIHCWSVGAFILSSLSWPTVPRVLTLTTPPSPAATRWLRVLTQESGDRCVLLPISATLRHAVLSAGVNGERVHVLRPGLSLGLVEPRTRLALREQWGVTNERTKIVMLLSDPPQAGDTVAAIMAVGLAEESFRDREQPLEFRVVVHPDQRHRRRAQALCRHLGRLTRVIQEPAAACPWTVLPGCDYALALGDSSPGANGNSAGVGASGGGDGGGGGLSLLWAMAANVPIVGEATYAISEIVEDHHSALLAKPGQSKSLAHRISPY